MLVALNLQFYPGVVVAAIKDPRRRQIFHFVIALAPAGTKAVAAARTSSLRRTCQLFII
jgi:hypothetical protein